MNRRFEVADSARAGMGPVMPSYNRGPRAAGKDVQPPDGFTGRAWRVWPAAARDQSDQATLPIGIRNIAGSAPPGHIDLDRWRAYLAPGGLGAPTPDLPALPRSYQRREPGPCDATL